MRLSVPDARLYELIELIYAAAQDPDRWQEFVTGVADSVPGVSAALMVRSASADSGLFIVHAMFSPGAIPEYLRNHAESSPWITILRTVETGVPFATEDLVPLASIKATPFYKNLLKPYAIGGGFGVKLWDRADGRAMFIVTCAEAQLSAMKPALLPLVGRLTPHLQRSLALCWALRRERARGLEDGLSRQADAVFVLNDRGEAVYFNAAARAAVEQRVVRLLAGSQRFRLGSRKDDAAFDELLKSAMIAQHSGEPPVPFSQALSKGGKASPRQRKLMTFTAPGGNGPNLLEILSLPAAGARTVDSIFHDRQKEPHFLVIIRRRGALVPPSIDDIKTIFGLSQREAEVALALVEGKSVEDLARARDVSTDTVRWHLKNIYRRTDCNSQADLVRLVLSLVGRAGLG